MPSMQDVQCLVSTTTANGAPDSNGGSQSEAAGRSATTEDRSWSIASTMRIRFGAGRTRRPLAAIEIIERDRR